MNRFSLAGFFAALLVAATFTQAQPPADMPEPEQEPMSTPSITVPDTKPQMPGMPHMPEMPKPTKEHEWLKQFVGQWEWISEMSPMPMKPDASAPGMTPDAPDAKPVTCTGTETVHPVGGFWIISKVNGTMMDAPFNGFFTLGYDPEKQKYVGTWVDSMNSHLWTYEGTLDETGKFLTLNSEGPCPCSPGKISKFKEVIEIKGPDHRVFTSSIQGDDGQWNTMMTIHYTRKK